MHARPDFPGGQIYLRPNPGRIILEGDSSYVYHGQVFLGKCSMPPGHIGMADRFSSDTGGFAKEKFRAGRGFSMNRKIFTSQCFEQWKL